MSTKRIIKFRGWNTSKKEMIDGVIPVELQGHGMAIVGNGMNYQGIYGDQYTFDGFFQLGPFEIMQFTGLVDMHRKEIYEGDIVRILYTDWPSQTPNEKGEYDMSLEDYKKSRSTIGVVDWDTYSTGWILRVKSPMSVGEDGTVMSSILHGPHGEREVIGNIHHL